MMVRLPPFPPRHKAAANQRLFFQLSVASGCARFLQTANLRLDTFAVMGNVMMFVGFGVAYLLLRALFRIFG